jgi:hypothetical protein
MNKIIGLSFFFSLLIASAAYVPAQEAQMQGTILITTTPPDYGTWKLKRINMQLNREHNSATISSLLQPAAVLGSVLFGSMAILLAVSVFSGGGTRDAGKDLVNSIDLFIRLVKAPFTLQYEKNKACDRIAELHEELARRGSATS